MAATAAVVAGVTAEAAKFSSIPTMDRKAAQCGPPLFLRRSPGRRQPRGVRAARGRMLPGRPTWHRPREVRGDPDLINTI